MIIECNKLVQKEYKTRLDENGDPLENVQEI